MGNGDTTDPHDAIKKDLEIKKLKREIEQLDFESEKRSAEARFEKSKRELELASLQRLEAKDAREAARAPLETNKLTEEINKLKREREQLDNDSRPKWALALRWSRIIGPIGSFITGSIALLVSFLSLGITSRLTEQQTNKLRADQILDQDRFFRETVEKATEPAAPIYRRIAFIWALHAFWNKRQSPALASVLVSMLRYDPDDDIQQASVGEINRAYSSATDQEARSVIKQLLFGSAAQVPGGAEKMGMVQETWNAVSSNSPIRKALPGIISEARDHLEGTNFRSFSVDGLFLVEAKFSGSDLTRADATLWTANRADFSRCDLTYATFSDCSLRNAKFGGATLRQARFRGSDLEGADFTGVSDADTCDMAGANISHVTGFDEAQTDRFFREGAVEMSKDNFDKWKSAGQRLPSDANERLDWRKAGFSLGPDRNPILSDGHKPKHGLQPAVRNWRPGKTGG